MKLRNNTIIFILLISYLLLLSYWMLLGFGRTTQMEYMYNLKPLITIGQFLQTDHYNSKIWIINLLGNIGVFVPFGILLPLLVRRRIFRAFFIFICGLLLLELMQLVSRRGSFDIDDFILNSMGFALGYGLLKVFCLYENARRGGIA